MAAAAESERRPEGLRTSEPKHLTEGDMQMGGDDPPPAWLASLPS